MRRQARILTSLGNSRQAKLKKMDVSGWLNPCTRLVLLVTTLHQQNKLVRRERTVTENDFHSLQFISTLFIPQGAVPVRKAYKNESD